MDAGASLQRIKNLEEDLIKKGEKEREESEKKIRRAQEKRGQEILKAREQARKEAEKDAEKERKKAEIFARKIGKSVKSELKTIEQHSHKNFSKAVDAIVQTILN